MRLSESLTASSEEPESFGLDKLATKVGSKSESRLSTDVHPSVFRGVWVLDTQVSPGHFSVLFLSWINPTKAEMERACGEGEGIMGHLRGLGKTASAGNVTSPRWYAGCGAWRGGGPLAP